MKKIIILFCLFFVALSQSWTQTITVTSPNGGETLSACQTWSITWTSTGTSGTFDIAYSIDNGVNWSSIGSNVTTLSYPWTVPNIQSSQVKIRVMDQTNNTIQDQSNAFFTITAAVVLTAPNGGEVWQAGTTQNITWNHAVSASFPTTALMTLEYSTDGITWINITTNVQVGSLTFSWAIPLCTTASNFCRVRIFETSAGATGCRNDLSNNDFSITASAPPVTLTSPNGGEIWQANTTQNITWTATTSATFFPTTTLMTLQYSTNNGTTWNNIATNVQAGAQTFAWLIPGVTAPSTTCLVRIFETSVGVTSCKSDVSNSLFNITAATPVLSVTNPNTASTLYACQSTNITWTYQYAPTNNAVKVEYTFDNGVTWNLITASTTGTSIPWTIPATPSSTCRIKVTSLDNPSIFDESNVNFTIVNPTITVTAPNTALTLYQYQTQNITWTSTNLLASATLSIELSLDNGLTWTQIATVANNGTYNWTVGATPTTQGLIRISTTCNSTLSDVSNTNFTIAIPAITVNAPNTSTSFCFGTSTNITWSTLSTSLANVKIEYSTDNGATWNVIIASTPNDGTHPWSIPNTPSNQCLVKISDPLNAANFDISNVTFTIPPVLTNVTSPNGGEILTGCTTQTITFAKCGTTGTTKLEYSIDNGLTWTQIATGIASAAVSYVWTVPNVSSTQCLIRATDELLSVSDISNAVFTIQPSLQIISPNGGENFQVGGPNQTISWIKNGTFTGTFTLQYSIDNGTTWTNITTGLANTNTSFSWVIPNAPSTQCRVRIFEGATPPTCKIDASDNVFTISAATPIITVTAPNTNITLYAGASTNITWTYPYYTSNNVKLEYSIDNGVTWNTIIASTPNDGTQAWNPIPNTPSPYCLVRVSDVTNQTLSDVSDVNFQIATPTVTLTSPNGGNSLEGCSTFPITWTSVGFTNNVKLEYSTDNGLTWNIIVASVTNNGTYNWTVPNTVNSTNCLVRITNVTLSYVTDNSNSPFGISNNTQVTLYSPNGGENWTANSTQTISWLATGLTNMTIQYSTNNGSTWTTVSTTVANTGSYIWTVPNVASPQCLVRIYETTNSCKSDQSSDVFTISAQVPVITVTAPNTAVTWNVGSTNAITWSIANGTIANVKLEYSTDNGNTWNTIIASTPAASGTSNWLIPNAPSTFCLVRVSDALTTSVFDVSNVNFTIAAVINPQPIVLTEPNGGEILGGCTGSNINWTSTNNTPSGRLIGTGNGTVGSITGTGPWSAIISGLSSTTGIATGQQIFASNGTGSIGSGGTYSVTGVTLNTITFTATGGTAPLAGTITNLMTTTIGTTGTVSSITGTGPWSGTITGLTNTTGLAVGSIFTATNGIIGSIGTGTCTVTTIVSATSITFTATGGTAPVGGTITNVKTSGTTTSYKIELSSDNGSSWSTITNGTPLTVNGACSYLWNPVTGNVNSTNCLIKVTNNSNIAQNDQSNSVFTITKPIILTEPNLGGTYVAGTTMNITWLSNGVSGIYNIWYSTDGGTTWNFIVSNQSISTNSYQWTIPAIATTQLKIRVSESPFGCKYDDSDVNSTIVLTPQPVVVTAPNGGESWASCSTQNITWTSTNPSGTYKLEYSTNGGSSWTQIATNVAAGTTGSYSWTIPNTISGSCLVRITDLSNLSNPDQSNAAFNISQGVPLTVTANSSICTGQSINLIASGANTYSWSPTTGLSDLNIANPVATPTSTITYTVTGTLNGCTNSKNVTVTVNPYPNVSINQNNVTMCSGVTLQANGAATYSWSPANGLSNASIANPVATPTSSTLYTVSGTLNGCTSTASVTVHPIPSISASAVNTTICSGTSTNLTASGATTYTWSPSIGLSSATIANPVANPSTTQSYTVTGVSNGCSSTSNITINVNASPNLTVGSGGSICAGSSFNLTSSGATTYNWSPAIGLSNTSISNPVATPTSTTTYTLTGSNGTCSTVKTVTVAVIPIPTIAITGNQTICTGSSTVLTASGGSSYVWTPTTGLSNPWVSNPSASPTTNTTYTVTSSVNGCQGTGTFALNVTSAPTIAPLFTQVLPICSGANISVLPTTSGNGIVGTWSPAINNATTTNYTFTPNSGQCAQNATMTITVNSLPNATVNSASPTTFCQGDSVLFNANTGTGLTYQWLNNGTNITGANSSSFTATASGSYAVIVTNSNNCSATSTATAATVNPLTTPTFTQVPAICSGGTINALPTTSENSIIGSWSPALNNTATSTYTFTPNSTQSPTCATNATMTITVNSLPTATVTSVSPTSFCQGDSVLFNANTGTGLTYQWLNNGTPITGANSSSFSATASGSYAVIVTNSNNCSATSTATAVTVNPLTTPTFTQVSSICSGGALNALPTTSTNGITGSWSPALNNTVTTTYTFTPSSTQSPTCATNATMIITVNPLPQLTLASFNSICDTVGIVALTGGSPTGGIYSGSSVSNNSFNSSIGSGVYPITYTYTSNNGCSSSATQNLTVINCSSSSIVEFNESGIILFPNPAFESFVIETTGNYIGKTFEILDISGRLLFSGRIEGNKTLVSISDYTIGTYYLKILENNKVLRFIKQ